MSTTNSLLFAILVVLLLKFFPGETSSLAVVAITGFALYGCYWLVFRFPAWSRKRKAEKVQAEQDEHDFWEWSKQHDAVRAKFDPNDQWNEATTPPLEYRNEIRNLNSQYRGMLQRRNGWSANDFLDSD